LAGIHHGAASTPACSWSCVLLPAPSAHQLSLRLRSRQPVSAPLSGSRLIRDFSHRRPPPSCLRHRSSHLHVPSACSAAHSSGGSPSCGGGPAYGQTSSSLSFAPTAWDCSDSARAKARPFKAGSGDTCGCRFLPGGAVMAAICAPLRASGETLGLTFRIGRRRRLSVVLLLEGVVLFARGVLGDGFRDVGRLCFWFGLRPMALSLAVLFSFSFFLLG
jgi:hypothetical protein